MDNQQPETPQKPADNISTEWNLIHATKLAFFTVGLIIIALFTKCTEHKHDEDKGNEIVVQHGTKTVIQVPEQKVRNKAHDVVPYVPPEGNITITPKDSTKKIEEVINVHRKIMGFTFEPGLSTAFPMYPSIGLDAKLLYYERWGTGFGLLAGHGFTLGYSPYVFISRRIDDKFSLLKNTEVWAGYVPLNQVSVAIGIRINL